MPTSLDVVTLNRRTSGSGAQCSCRFWPGAAIHVRCSHVSHWTIPFHETAYKSNSTQLQTKKSFCKKWQSEKKSNFTLHIVHFLAPLDWLIDWSVDWSIDWLIDWWVGWLIDWICINNPKQMKCPVYRLIRWRISRLPLIPRIKY